MSSAERAIESAVVRLGHLLVTEIKFLNGVHGDVYWMQSELRWMSCFLEDADVKRKNGDKRTKNWIREVTNIAHEAEDIVDKFMLQIELKRKQKSGLFKMHLCIPCKLVDLHYIGTDILQIRSKIHSISESKDRYGINSLSESSDWTDEKLQAQRNISPNLLGNKFIVGFGGIENLILKRLLNSEVKKRVVVSIVGMGGLGKTTLATMIYNNNLLKDWFTYHAWVTVSEQFKPPELLLNIIRQVGGNPEEYKNMDTRELKSELHKCLKGEKYIIVLDDIWEQNVWQQLKDAFPNEDGSRILITTRFIEVGKSADPSNPPYELPLLDDKMSWQLFLSVVFPSEDGSEPNCPEELKTLGKDLVKKCGGLPMGVIMLGGLLSITDPTINAWKKVANKWKYQDSNLWILALSYNHLPNANMKSCFLYIGNYPEDHRIRASEITKIWIAEGFIPKEVNQTFEETAKDYLDEFVLRCMVQVDERTETSKRVKFFRIHDLFRKWCISEAQNDGFFHICTSNSDTSDPDIIAARRLVVYESIIDNRFCDLSYNARALLGFNYLSAGNFLSKNIGHNFELLRVLYLNFPQSVEVHKSKLLNGVSRLIHLRNITLISEALKFLPSSIGKLQNLQTINIKYTGILKLPKTICKIPNLRHLYTRGVRIRSATMWKSRNLQTLDSISGGSWMLKDIAKLLNLRKLSISRITNNGVRGLQDSLHKLNHLKSLCLESDGQSDPSLFKSFKSHNPLSKLVLINWSGVSSKFPQNLISIKLSGCSFEKGAIASLENLERLANLNLEDCDIHSEDDFVFSGDGFKKLENLLIGEMRSLLDWKIFYGALPQIKYLMIKASDWLAKLPDGLEHLKSLQKLEMMEFKENLKNRLLETLEDRHKIPQITLVTLNGTQLDQYKRPAAIMHVSGDEPVLPSENDVSILSSEDDESVSGRTFYISNTRVMVSGKMEAPLVESKHKVVLDVMGSESFDDRPGVDIIIAVDVGWSNLRVKKLAMKLMLEKLSSNDRFCIVLSSSNPSRLCPLRQINEGSRVEIENLIDGIISGGDRTSTSAGLQLALTVLRDRRFTTGRLAAILLLSDGIVDTDDYSISQAMLRNIPVYTFGLGEACENASALKEISNKSMGGTFSYVQNPDYLITALSQCLAGLFTVAISGLWMTIRQISSKIQTVFAGNRPQSTDVTVGSVTVDFGEIYAHEVCKVIVDLCLPAVEMPRTESILQITMSTAQGLIRQESDPIDIVIVRR